MVSRGAQKAMAAVQAALCFAGYKAKEFAKEERGASDVIAVVAIAAVAVALAVVFRGQIETFIQTVVGTFTQTVNDQATGH